MNYRSPNSNAALQHCLGVLFAAAAMMPSLSDAQELNQTARAVRRYPDPGYCLMGVYAGGPRTYFDYSLAKMSLGDTLVVPLDELKELTKLDVTVELQSTSGVEQGAKACATLNGLSIRAR